MIKVSVIVPVYNVENYIKKCLDSLLAQTLLEIEVLIVNDGSRDTSREIAMTYVSENPHFHLLDKENGGLSDARNFGLKQAQGEYVAFIDSDDCIAPQMLAEMYKRALATESDLVCCDLKYIYDDGTEKISSGADFEVSSFIENPAIIGINNSACNKLYRRSFIQTFAFPQGQWYEDLAVIPIWVAKANRVAYISEAYYDYFQREGSIAHSCTPKLFDIYDSIHHVQTEVREIMESEIVDQTIMDFYLDNGLVMTTLRIKDADSKEQRMQYYQENMLKLNEYCPNWFKAAMKKKYHWKQKLIFRLLKWKAFGLVDRIYR